MADDSRKDIAIKYAKKHILVTKRCLQTFDLYQRRFTPLRIKCAK